MVIINIPVEPRNGLCIQNSSCDDRERIITGAVIATGEMSDGKQLQGLFEKTVEAGMQVKTVFGDRANSEKGNIANTKTNEIVTYRQTKSPHYAGCPKTNFVQQRCRCVKLDKWLFEKLGKARRARVRTD